jgi:hypothetical protein
MLTFIHSNGFAYFGIDALPAVIVKIRLRFYRCSLINSNGFAYFGTSVDTSGQSPGVIVKISLSDLARVGGLTLEANENGFYSALLDSLNCSLLHAFAACNRRRIIRVRGLP